MSKSQAEIDVLAERQRQIDVEGWTHVHDDEHKYLELEHAANCYMDAGSKTSEEPAKWPWDSIWWKPKSERENLVRAGALFMAEKGRLGRTGYNALSLSPGGIQLKIGQCIAKIERLDRQENERAPT